jgi:hypothetical protein
VARLRDCIDDFKEIMPCVEELINPALKLRHWDEIFDLIGADIPDNDDGTGALPACTYPAVKPLLYRSSCLTIFR